MTIHTSAALVVTRAGDNVQVELPNGDVLVLSPESARQAAYFMTTISERIQCELAEARKDARKAITLLSHALRDIPYDFWTLRVVPFWHLRILRKTREQWLAELDAEAEEMEKADA